MENNITGDFIPQSTLQGTEKNTTGSSGDQTGTLGATAPTISSGWWSNFGNTIGIIGGIFTILGILIAYFWGVSSQLNKIENNTNDIIEKVDDIETETKEIKSKVDDNKSSIKRIEDNLIDIKYNHKK